MFLTLIKRAVKAALHEATEEWMLETGLSQEDVAELRAQRIAFAAQVEAQADSRAALALNVEDDEDDEEVSQKPLALPMPSAARITGQDCCPAPNAGEESLLAWVHQQREKNVSWAEVGRLANEAGHAIGEDALRMRYKRHKEKVTQAVVNNGDSTPTS